MSPISIIDMGNETRCIIKFSDAIVYTRGDRRRNSLPAIYTALRSRSEQPLWGP